ncbi:MAG: chemotaxis protein CheA [Pseudomonadota bacterium]|nr:chemotaxis protein CheA [Pseudomonadota bacterium]
MSASVDDDIRSDFLAEAGELLERVSGQLIELEAQPQDAELLNAIFRAFHTVKGGAGFLNLSSMVELCHATEDVFNALRSGRRSVDAGLLDAVLQALDQVQGMMSAVAANTEPQAAPPELVRMLHDLANGVTAAVTAPVAPPPEKKRKAAKVATAAPAPAAAGDLITDDEFEALLDQLHGKPGAAPAPAQVSLPPEVPPAAKPTPVVHAATPEAETTIRVDTHRLDKLMNLVGELVLVRNRLKSLRSKSMGETSARAISELDFITRGLQGAVMQIRMQPLRKVFSRFPKLARDVARGLGKQVEVTLEGQDTDLDKSLVEALADPLVHMVRNSVDHGIEMPEERIRLGKPAAGQLKLSAQQAGDHILIVVSDDGAGMDAERIRGKAIEKGLLDRGTAAQLSAEECLQLVCLPGFSTKEQVSDLSGRGVGMDVVMSRIKTLNGSVHIQSRLGHGSEIHIRVPLTLAILPALIVECEARNYALPLSSISDVFQLDPAAVQKLDRWDVVLTRVDTLRLVPLDPWLSPLAAAGPRHVVVAKVGEERFGFVVHEVRGREEIVIKPLGASLRGLAGVAGATVMPDGRVALILDFAGLVEAWKRSLGMMHG